MSLSCIHYSELERTLARLGFTKRITVSGHIHFEHPSGAVFATRAYKPDEIAREIIVIAARSTVAGWGVVDQETFERLLAESAEQAAAPTTAAA